MIWSFHRLQFETESASVQMDEWPVDIIIIIIMLVKKQCTQVSCCSDPV